MKYVIGIFMMFGFMGCGQTIAEHSGLNGLNGLNGATGATGAQGAPGEACSVASVSASTAAPNGGSLISCPDGSQSLVLNGTNGVNGENGTPGSIVAPVQFCPGVTPKYPSTFPELGFCINQQLYAVYSANGGFLTQIEPGRWESNAIGSSCSFTVGANCQISQ